MLEARPQCSEDLIGPPQVYSEHRLHEQRTGGQETCDLEQLCLMTEAGSWLPVPDLPLDSGTTSDQLVHTWELRG